MQRFNCANTGYTNYPFKPNYSEMNSLKDYTNYKVLYEFRRTNEN